MPIRKVIALPIAIGSMGLLGALAMMALLDHGRSYSYALWMIVLLVLSPTYYFSVWLCSKSPKESDAIFARRAYTESFNWTLHMLDRYNSAIEGNSLTLDATKLRKELYHFAMNVADITPVDKLNPENTGNGETRTEKV